MLHAVCPVLFQGEGAYQGWHQEKKAPGPREFLLGLRCEKQGRKKEADVYRGNWKAKKRLVEKSMAKSAACLH